MSSNFQKFDSTHSYNINNLSIVTPEELNFDDLDPSQGFSIIFPYILFFFLFKEDGFDSIFQIMIEFSISYLKRDQEFNDNLTIKLFIRVT